MKKIVALLPVLLAVSSCSAATPASSAGIPDIPFSANAEISYCGMDCKAQITRSESGEWTFELTGPYAVEGLTLTVSDSETALNMFDSASISDRTENTVSLARAAAVAYDAATSSSADIAVKDNICTLSGTSELGAFTVELDSTGTPVHLTSECGQLSVTLSDFTQLPPQEFEAVIVQ